LPALIKATRDPAREVQLESALAVLSISMGDESTSLEDESTAEVHRTAIESVRDDLLAVLIAAVDAQDMERVNLHRVLGERGSWPDTWLPFLEKFIRSEDPAVCGLAAAVLTYPPPDSALQLLLDCRQAENTYVRHAAVIGLSHLALNHSEALAGLVRSLEDVSDDVRSATVSELSSLGSLAIVPQILAALGSENERVRSGAAQAIRKGFEDLDDIDVFGRDRPAPRTVALAVAARAILEALKPLLTDPSPAVREEVAWALGYVAKWTFHRGKEVLDLLSDHDPRVRAGAATAVSICGGGRQGLASRLLAALEGLTGGERAACLRALGAAYREAEIVLPQLLKALESGGDEERQAASWALHRLGTRALPADPHLRRLVQDRSLPPDVRRVAWYAFEKIHRDDHERLFPELATATSDPQGEILSDAFKFLERLGEKARPAIPSLLDVLRSGRREEVGRALKLLDRLSECTPAVVRLIVERARTADPSLLGVLSSVARGNEAAFQGLQEALADRSLRREAVLALATTGNAGRSVLPELRRLAREDDRELQDAIAPTVLAIEQARDGE
jgi:HEAT repeat protein